MRIAALLLALTLSVPAIADGDTVTLTSKATDWVLKKPGTPDVVLSRYPTEKLCEAAIVKAGDFVCDQRVNIKAVGACAATAPAFPVKVDADGFLVLPRLVVEALPSGEWGPTMEEGYLPTVQPYPACWVMGLVPYTGTWHAPEGEPDTTPACWPGSDAPACVKP